MTRYTVGEIAAIVGGRFLHTGVSFEYPVHNLITDSRGLFHPENSVFFALKGIRHDGHSFVSELAAKGVRVFVVSSVSAIRVDDQIALIRVEDTLKALQKLAAFHRSRFSIPVVGITGSNGKTVIKEWLHDLLSDHFSIIRSPKSYNSQIGVPLSVWNLVSGNDLGIFEAGISMPGEMAELEKIIRPDTGIFTNIGDAHQENFRSLRQKTGEKLKLFERSKKIIFCADHPEAAMIRHFCKERGIRQVGWSLENKRAVITFRSFPENGGTRLTARGKNMESSFFIPFADPSSVENCCHCFVAAVTLGMDPDETGVRFRRLVPLSMRLEIRKGMNNCLLVNDMYNSDINSLALALNVLNRQAETNHLRKTVILSDIRQSGIPGPGLYAQVSRLLEDAGVQNIFGIGQEISGASSLFSQEKRFFLSTAEFISNMKPSQFTDSAILIKGARDFRFEEISEVLQQKAHRTVLEINLDALVDNLNAFRSLLPGDTKIMVVVKAFSYGSGDVEIAKLLQHQRVDCLAVAVADEGKELRQAGVTLPILVMNPEPHSFRQMIDYQLEPNLYSIELAGEFARAVDLHALPHFPVHLKVDTGMNRLGIKSDDEIGQMLELFRFNPQLRLQSVFSHLAASEDPSSDQFTVAQIQRFEEVCERISRSIGYPVVRHILNSAGIERFNRFRFEMVRLGIGLYGVGCGSLHLKPVGRLKSVISQTKEVVPGETIGYNRTGKMLQKSRIAVLPVGYADGLDRRLGNGIGRIFVNGKYAPYVGNICMDMCMADITGIDCKPGDEVEIFGEHLTVEEMAKAAGTIPYEILTGISQRVKRVYLQE